MHTSPVLCTALPDRTGYFPLNTFSRRTAFAETFSHLTCALHFFRLADCHLTFPCTSLPPSSSPVCLFLRPFFRCIFYLFYPPQPRPPPRPHFECPSHTSISLAWPFPAARRRLRGIRQYWAPLVLSVTTVSESGGVARNGPKSPLASFSSSFISFPFISDSRSTLFSVPPLPLYSLCELGKTQILKCDDPEIWCSLPWCSEFSRQLNGSRFVQKRFLIANCSKWIWHHDSDIME